MDVHVVCELFLLLGLFSHAISVPVSTNYYDNTQPEGYQVSDDITQADPYDRFPRNILSRPYILQKYGWFPRSLIPSRPRQPSRRHFHLFHLTSKHPNAVSYHVIEKPHATRTINHRHKVTSNTRRSDLYNNNALRQDQSVYPTQSYYQQPAYQYSGYPTGYGSSLSQIQYGVQNGGRVHDSTYDDILQEVAKPMQFPNTPAYTRHQNARQNDQTSTSIEEAAKEFKLASADMNNMELASLVIYPIPRFRDGNRQKDHKKKSIQKRKKFHSKVKEQKPKLKIKNQEQAVTNLVDKLIKNDKEGKSVTHENSKDKKKFEEDKEGKAEMTKDKEDKEKMTDDKNDDEKKLIKENKKEKEHDKEKKQKIKDEEENGMNEEDNTSKDSWNEEDISTNGEEFTSSKRSEIPSVIDEVSKSDDDKVELTDESEVNDEARTKSSEIKDHKDSRENDESKDQQNESEEKDEEVDADGDEAENKSEKEGENDEGNEMET